MTSVESWTSDAQSHLSNVGELRQNVLDRLRQGGGGGDTVDEVKSPPMGGPMVEDQLKRRQRTTQGLSVSLSMSLEKVQHTIFQVRQYMSDLSRKTTHIKAALSVVDTKMELRAQRPPSEQVEDSFQEALQHEQTVLMEALHECIAKLEAGGDVVMPLEEAKAAMQANRLTVHLDRTGHTQVLLDRVTKHEKSSEQFCKEAQRLLEDTERRTKRALAKTCSAMKQRIAATVAMKDQIEKDMQETRRTISEVELRVNRMHRELVIQRNMPERRMDNMQGDFCNKKLAARTGALAEMRSRIKAAAYTGAQGRRLDVLFSRFDRDATGMLDEDEVRKALRTVCKIPPHAVSDAEISSLCSLLDEDKSGCVSISEIIDFLCADCDLEELEENLNWGKNALETLKSAQQQSQGQLRNKIAAWKIDLDCSKVSIVKSLKLDSLPSPGRPTGRPATSSTPRQPYTQAASSFLPSSSVRASLTTPRAGLGSQASPRSAKVESLPSLTNISADSATAENLRNRIKSAAFIGSSGKQIEALFKRFDKDGSGQLGMNEVRQAIRKHLRIPPATLSDADISSLCVLLDADKSGTVNVSELLEFVGAEPTASKKTGKVMSNARHGAPDESAGPPSD